MTQRDLPKALPDSPASSVEITLTEGNVQNNHIYLRDHLSFFPPDAIGGSSRADEGRSITLRATGLGMIGTDIDGSKKIFRNRGFVRDFLASNRARAGDAVLIIRSAEREYRLTLRKSG